MPQSADVNIQLNISKRRRKGVKDSSPVNNASRCPCPSGGSKTCAWSIECGGTDTV